MDAGSIARLARRPRRGSVGPVDAGVSRQCDCQPRSGDGTGDIAADAGGHGAWHFPHVGAQFRRVASIAPSVARRADRAGATFRSESRRAARRASAGAGGNYRDGAYGAVRSAGSRHRRARRSDDGHHGSHHLTLRVRRGDASAAFARSANGRADSRWRSAGGAGSAAGGDCRVCGRLRFCPERDSDAVFRPRDDVAARRHPNRARHGCAGSADVSAPNERRLQTYGR